MIDKTLKQVNEAIVIPAAFMIEMIATATKNLLDGELVVSVANLNILAPMALTDKEAHAYATVNMSYAGQANIVSEAHTKHGGKQHCVGIVAQTPSFQQGIDTLPFVCLSKIASIL